MSEPATDYRKYLEPRTLARIASLDLRARLVVEGLMAGMHRSPYQGISVEFVQHRQYVPGDDIRHVDWKVFAKTDKVYLKQYLEETNLHLICVVDASESMGYGSVGDQENPWSKYDHATAIAASLSYLAIQQQDSVGLAIFDSELRRYFKPSNSPAQWKTITHELLIVPRLKKTGTGRVLDQLAEKLTHRSLVVVLSDFFDDIDSIQQGLRHLRYRKHEVMAFQVLDPMEVDFPFDEVTLFKGLEEMGELLTEPQSLRKGYLAELSAFTDRLKKICRGMHIDFTQMNSGQALDVALSSFSGSAGGEYSLGRAILMMYQPTLAFALIAPLFLAAGAGLVAVPILIHILNRRRFKVVPWAAMEFLLRAMKKNRRRLRFEQLLLLATRCLLLLLIGFALSRPLGCQDSSLANIAGRRTGLHVFVINTGYSMSYEVGRAGAKTHLDQAKIIAKALIHRLASGGESVAIVTASSPPRQILGSPIYDLKAAEDAVNRIEQSYGASDEVGALALARDIARREPANSNKSLYLIDDSTRVAWETRGDVIQELGHELADLYKSGITHFNLGKPGEWNQAVVGLQPAESLVTSRFSANLVSDVRGYGPCPTDPKMSLSLDGVALPPGMIGVHPTAAASPQTFTVNNLTPGIHVFTASLASDNRLPIDDVRYRVVNVVGQIKVLIVEGERGVGGQGSSGAFLDAALNPTGYAASNDSKAAGYVATERISDLELGNKVLTDYRCICLCGVGQIQDAEAAQLEQYVRQGGTVMIFMGDPVTAENYNATLYKHHLLPGPLSKRIMVSGDQTPRRFDFDPHRPLNRLLADFQNQEDTGMDTAEVYSYWQMDLPPNSTAERVLNFLPADGSTGQPEDPAITVNSLGNGQTLFYATSADPNAEWTTFMPHPAYPALMHMLLLGTTRGNDSWMNIAVNNPLRIPPSIQLTGAPVLKDAMQTEYPMELQTISDATSPYFGQSAYASKPLMKPGIYSLATGTDNYKIAVNVPALEAADVRTIGDTEVRKALGDIEMEMQGDSVPAPAALAKQGKDLGWAMMVGVFGLLAVESLMAMRFGHHRRK